MGNKGGAIQARDQRGYFDKIQDREHDACVQFGNFPDKPYSFDKYTRRDTGAFYLRGFHYKRTKADSEI